MPNFKHEMHFTKEHPEMSKLVKEINIEFIEASEDGILEAICFISSALSELDDEEKKKTAITVIGNLSLIRDFLKKIEKQARSGLLIGLITNKYLQEGIEMIQ
jgi:hypothetical protein